MSEIASMALDLLAGSVVFQIPHKPNAKLVLKMGFHRSVKNCLILHTNFFIFSSGSAQGIVVGTRIPNFCVMSDTVTIAKEIQKQGEGMRILISQPAKLLLDKVGGFRCDPKGTLDLPVKTNHKGCHQNKNEKFVPTILS